MRSLAALALAAGLLAAGPAMARDWRYCLSLTGDEQGVYMTSPFQTDASLAAVQAGFARALDGGGLAHGEAQCPRAGSEAEIETLRDNAKAYNLRNKRPSHPVDWRPAGAVAAVR